MLIKMTQLTDDQFGGRKMKVGHNLRLVVTTHTVVHTKQCRKKNGNDVMLFIFQQINIKKNGS